MDRGPSVSNNKWIDGQVSLMFKLDIQMSADVTFDSIFM